VLSFTDAIFDIDHSPNLIIIENLELTLGYVGGKILSASGE
jgi:hypothetical protein